MTELKPCPFCGSSANSELIGGFAPTVSCENLKCSVFIMDINGVFLDEVEKQWNERAAEKDGE